MNINNWHKRNNKRIYILLLVVLVIAGTQLGCSRTAKKIVFKDHLSETVLTVDGENLTLADMAFYVIYQEDKVEKQAAIYDSSDTTKYWKSHVNGRFLVNIAKEAVVQMAVRDVIYSRQAESVGITLTAAELEQLQERVDEFYDVLTTEQKEAVGVDKITIAATMHKAALAEKVASGLAIMNGVSPNAYGTEGAAYQQELAQHTYTLNETLWGGVNLGYISIIR